LSVAKQIVELHGGRLVIGARQGGGVEARVEVPIIKEVGDARAISVEKQ
jgi:signal transduction histidine kinase